MDSQPTKPVHDELERADDGRPTTSRTGAGGEAYSDADASRSASTDSGGPAGIDDAIVGQPGSGGAAAGFVGTPADADVPDPLGGEDDERELERRTR